MKYEREEERRSRPARMRMMSRGERRTLSSFGVKVAEAPLPVLEEGEETSCLGDVVCRERRLGDAIDSGAVRLTADGGVRRRSRVSVVGSDPSGPISNQK